MVSRSWNPLCRWFCSCAVCWGLGSLALLNHHIPSPLGLMPIGHGAIGLLSGSGCVPICAVPTTGAGERRRRCLAFSVSALQMTSTLHSI